MAYTKDQINELYQLYTNTLFNDSIPFWLNHAVDREQGGIMTCVDQQGNLFDTDKGVWQQGRFAWVMGHLYNNCETSAKNPVWLEECRQTLEFVEKYAFDEDGRMFFQLTRDGRPIRKRRYAFSESFGAISFGELAKADGSEHAKELALKCYNIFANHVPNPPKFTDVRPMIGLGYYAILIATIQQLRDSIQLEGADAKIDECIEMVRKYFMKPEIRCVMECVAPNGDIVDSCEGRTLNPGHAIEGAWFIMDEGKRRNRPDYIQTGLDILDWMWERGWDKEYGGMLYFRDVYDKPSVEYWHDMKFWWNHNETIIATLLAYQLTGDDKYADMHKQVHDWAFEHFTDREYGDWFGYLHRDGTISSTQKGNIFKGCFHLPRMLWECSQICKQMLEK